MIDGTFSDSVIQCFETALAGYPSLDAGRIRLKEKKLENMTMRAQPVFNRHIFSKNNRMYQIDLQHRTVVNHNIAVHELDADVLTGWFAHELGHVMDYDHRGWGDLLRFGLGYLLFPTFRVGAERKADLYAIEHGFHKEILATKNFLLEESDLPDSYKTRLNKYYMTPEEVEMIVQQKNEGDVYQDRILDSPF